MNTAFAPMSWLVFAWAVAVPAIAHAEGPPPAPQAQAAPPGATANKPKPTAQSEAGEPQANTSPAPSEPGAPAARAPAAAPAVGRPAGRASGQKPAAAVDRLELGTATVTGDREQPKVMYIVPWKKSDIGDLSGKPMNSLLDEALAPVDRDEFKREVVYYDAVKSDASRNGASNKGAQGEK